MPEESNLANGYLFWDDGVSELARGGYFYVELKFEKDKSPQGGWVLSSDIIVGGDVPVPILDTIAIYGLSSELHPVSEASKCHYDQQKKTLKSENLNIDLTKPLTLLFSN